jgi:hypothetical protein
VGRAGLPVPARATTALSGRPDAQARAEVDAIRLVPPPGLVDAAAALPRPARTGDPPARLAAVVAAGAAGAYTWALDGPEAGRRVWGELAALGLRLLPARLEDPGPDSARFTLGSQVSTLAQWAWLAGDAAAGRAADLVACELATGGWPGRRPLDRPDLVLLCDPTGRHALDHAGSRVRLGSIRDFPVAGPEDGGSWRRPGTVDRLLDQVSRQSHLGGPLLGAAARLLRTLVHPAMGPPWPPAAALDAQRRLAALAAGDADAWAFALPWLLDTATRFPGRLARLLAA